MPEILTFAEMDYDYGKALDLRKELISIRDDLLAAGQMHEVVVLSHVIAYMSVTLEIVFER